MSTAEFVCRRSRLLDDFRVETKKSGEHLSLARALSKLNESRASRRNLAYPVHTHSNLHAPAYTQFVRRQQTLSERRFSILFVALLAFLVLSPYFERTGTEHSGVRIFGSIVILLSVYAVTFRRTFALLAFVLAIPTLLQRTIFPFGYQGTPLLLVTTSAFAFDLFIITVIFRRVFRMDQPNSEAIFGALCVYLLIGFSFANGYLLLSTLQPHAFYFEPTSNFPHVPGRFSFMYYSFGTLTSMGAAGITPASDNARSLTVIETVLGVLYLAVLISRLISIYKRPFS